jgi:hypothetical protein
MPTTSAGYYYKIGVKRYDGIEWSEEQYCGPYYVTRLPDL